MDYALKIAKELNLNTRYVENVLELLAEGATIPFISRYRKERTGSMDEVQIADVKNLDAKLREMDKRRETILKTIGEQGKLSPELEAKIKRALTLTELEDLYLPYKPKRRTRGSMAKEKGLEPLADLLQKQQERNIDGRAKSFLNDQVANIEEALQGARDIIAERINENAVARERVRKVFERKSKLFAKVARNKETEGAKYRDYFQFDEPLKRCPSHRLLAIMRGEEEGILRVSIAPPEEDALEILDRLFLKGNNAATEQVAMAIEDSYKRLLSSAIETEYRKMSKEKADEEAIKVFADNLRQLLLASPLGQLRVLALDPGYRSGCKLVCLDEQGNLIDNSVIYPHQPQNDVFGAKSKLKHYVERFGIEAIAIGNGTASRETEDLVRSIKFKQEIKVFVVSENGASVYSASSTAREEFPDHDVTVRGAVSIGRRLMDPLAELVKIDPKSIGVGQYQHDVDQNKLRASLDVVVESCVNRVGVNLNTASKHLLTYVSGLGPKLAQGIVDYRSQNGAFTSRTAIKKVPRLGPKAFEQAAGFLRIHNAKNPLDSSSVHPESYGIVKTMAQDLGCTVKQLMDSKELRKQIKINNYVTKTVGLPTLKDILKELEKPGLDPRGEAVSFSFAEGVKSINDLEEGMILPGIVTNITNFGCFVDVGVKQDGLIHISELANKYVSNPSEVVKLHQHVEVKVIGLDIQRNRVNLSMKQV